MKSSHYNEKEVIQHFPCEDVYLLFIQIKSTKMSLLFMGLFSRVQEVVCALSFSLFQCILTTQVIKIYKKSLNPIQ